MEGRRHREGLGLQAVDDLAVAAWKEGEPLVCASGEGEVRRRGVIARIGWTAPLLWFLAGWLVGFPTGWFDGIEHARVECSQEVGAWRSAALAMKVENVEMHQIVDPLFSPWRGKVKK